MRFLHFKLPSSGVDSRAVQPTSSPCANSSKSGERLAGARGLAMRMVLQMLRRMSTGDKATGNIPALTKLGSRERKDRGSQEGDENHRGRGSSSGDLHSRMFSP